MLSWMLYAIVVTFVFGLAAACWERAAIIGRWPARWGWVCAIALSVAVPIAHALWPEANSRLIIEIATAPSTTAAAWDSRLANALSATSLSAPGATFPMGQWLSWAWLSASMLTAVYFGLRYYKIQREYRRSAQAVIAGHVVAITNDLGPAVIGWLRPTIVLPRWLDQLTPEQRDLAVAHEIEHLRARDVQLLGANILVLVLFPWNAVLWWLFLRLRLAIEFDCDGRVLRKFKDPVQYGTMLLHASSLSAGSARVSPALFESTSSLEKRIRALVRGRARYDRWLVAVLAATSAIVASAATNVESPQKDGWQVASSSGTELNLPSPQHQFDEQWSSLIDVAEFFEPAVLQTASRGMTAYLFLVVDGAGRVAAHRAEFRPALQDDAISEQYARKVLEESGAQLSDAYTMFLQVRLRDSSRNPSAVVLAVDPAAKALSTRAPSVDLAAIRRDREWLQASLIRRAKIERSILSAADPAVIDTGLVAGDELWIALDSSGRYMNSGRRKIITDPNESRRFIQAIQPTYAVADVVRGTSVRDVSGNRIQVSWHWLAEWPATMGGWTTD
jgi:beta-lactamase regulating signal transducer with metallopeptidase domain